MRVNKKIFNSACSGRKAPFVQEKPPCTVTENPSNERFCFLKLSELKQLKSFLESGNILKQKWHKTIKNGMNVKTYIKCPMELSITHNQHSLPFPSIKELCTKNLNLTFHFRFWIIQFLIQEIAFWLWANQSEGRNSQEGEGEQLKFAPQFDKLA